MDIPKNDKELIDLMIKQRPKVLKSLATKFEHNLNKEDIEDVFSESCKKVWENIMHKDRNYLEDLASETTSFL